MVAVKFWILVGPLWLIALAALAGIFRLPGGTLDVYYHDRYVVVAKTHIILATILLVVALLLLTIWHFRSRTR